MPLPPGTSRRKDVVARCKLIITLTLLLFCALVPLAAAPHDAAASTLPQRLHAAHARLSRAQRHLTMARAALRGALTATGAPSPAATPQPASGATPAPDGSATPAPAAITASARPTVAHLKAALRHWRRAVRRDRRAVVRLTRRYRQQQRLLVWERRGQWTPIIRYAAARYHLSADSVRHMMMLESGGRRFAGAAGPYKGLFQYCTRTWHASWNPWHGDSIFDGSSQIFATCYAVHRGFGPHMWPNTYPRSF
jgi:hypothetical protein